MPELFEYTFYWKYDPLYYEAWVDIDDDAFDCISMAASLLEIQECGQKYESTNNVRFNFD